MFKRHLFVALLLMGSAIPASAQDIATRIFQMEERIRQLTGQVEELTFTVKQLERQLGKSGGESSGQLIAPQPAQPAIKSLADNGGNGIETIEELPASKPKRQTVEIVGSGNDGVFVEQPQTKNLAEGGNASAQEGDGGFEGQVLVAPDGNGQQSAAAAPQGEGIEQVSLQPAESPDGLYKTANEALLRRQFPEAEAGFRGFLAKYPDHSLAGSAQYWLGETFYVQGDVKQAAQNFLQAYKNYPKSRRAPDSLLKLGMSLGKMGQKDQACAALNSVSTEFPKAVEAKKRAAAEYKRAGC